MKKIFAFTVATTLTICSFAQTEKVKKTLDETLNTINEMDQMLGKDFKQITSALEAVDGASFTFGDCMVLGAYADEGFKKNCKTMEEEFEKTFNKSIWSFEKYNANSQSLVKVKTTTGKTEQSPYSGFTGDGTIKIGTLIEGLTIQAYWYQSKEDKNKYIMMFPVNQMGVFVEMTKKEGKTTSTSVEKKETDVATNTTPKAKEVVPATIAPKANDLKNKVKNKIAKKIKL